MRNLILYKSSYCSEVIGATRNNEPNITRMAGANIVINLATGEILKDRFDGRAGTFMVGEELRTIRHKHDYTPPNPKYFDEELFTL